MSKKAATEEREFDVVVWGATGFTGRLVANYFGPRAEALNLRWAIGGRSAERLQAIAAEIKGAAPSIVTGDSNSAEDMEALARRTRVVVSTVGPFIRYGTHLVAACVKCRTHYADITGETPWVRKLIDEFHSEAKQNGVCIVPMSGFDSVPADIGVFMLADYVAKKYGAQLGVVESVVTMNASASGGTMASMMELQSQPKSASNDLFNPFLLNPRGSWSSLRCTRSEKDLLVPYYHSTSKSWTFPFVMAAANTRVVRRTQALLEESYGPNFHYNEYARASGLLKAVIMWLVLTLFVIILQFRILRDNVLKPYLPKPGEGPSAERRTKSSFKYEIYGRVDYGKEKATGKPQLVKAVVAGGDPGYSETSKMLAEIGIALAQLSSRGELPVHPVLGGGGILTPAACLGSELVQRLQAAGLKLYVEDL